jgi:hypothetical protein
LGPQTFLSSNQCFSSDWYVLWGCFHDVLSSLIPSMMAHQPSHFSGVRLVHFPKSSQTFLWRSRLFAQVPPWVSKSMYIICTTHRYLNYHYITRQKMI